MRCKVMGRAAVVGAALSMLVASASAQPIAVGSYDYTFDDDPMVGDTLSSTPPILTLRTKLPRVMLIRPRASFVGEMFKSVEML